MEILLDLFLPLINQLPRKQAPKSIKDLAENLGDCLKIYEEQQLAAIKNGDAEKWITENLGEFGTTESKICHYETDNGFYFLLANSRLKTGTKEILKPFLKLFLSRPIKANYYYGFILLVQKQVMRVKINEEIYQSLTDGIDATLEDYNLLFKYRQKMGNTITIQTMKEWYGRGVPIQMFFGPIMGSKNVNLKVRSKRVRRIKTAINRRKCKIYIHAPYDFNLCDPRTNLDIGIRDLKDAISIGALGVVIHVGKNTGDNIPLPIAISRMYKNIVQLLEYATPDCPLLLETPAGQGNETLVKIGQMSAFYNRFTDEQKQKFKICIDTCHVWAAGYYPLKYLKKWHKTHPDSIKLIHFNDSKKPRGACLDRHFNPGGGFQNLCKIVKTETIPKLNHAGQLGYIGVKRMAKIAQWCIENNLDCVNE